MTMYRYMTLMWNRADPDAQKAADFLAAKLNEVSPHAWRKAWGVPGLAVFDSGHDPGRMQTYRLDGDRGVVLGRLFHRDYTSQTTDLDDALSRKCIETRGQHLIDHCWGRYVTFLHDPASNTHWIMRDPTGAFPCFHTPFEGVEIYFSDMQDAANFDFLRFSVNWEFLKTNIMLAMFQKTHTGLNEVGEVLPAECVEITPFERTSRFVWDPTQIATTEVVEDPDEAATLLRTTVKNTIGALASCYDRVVHNLGGLDSSIVLACMADAPKRPEITCINYFTKSPRGEERFYSRQVADKFDAPLVEMELEYRKADLTKISRSNKLANPLGFFDCIGLTDNVLELAKETNAQALFYGVGGDNVFFQPKVNLGGLDHVRTHGLSKDTLRIAMEAARYGRKSLTKTLRDMLHERFSPAPCYSAVHESLFDDLKIPLVNPDFVSDGNYERFLHPLLIPDQHSLKAKHFHILICALYSKDYYDHWDTDYCSERILAYLYQPIIETCLRIPVWVLTYGGVDRGLARRSFRQDVPQGVIRRVSKSTPVEFYDEIYNSNISILREFLIDGIMVQKGILLREKLEIALNRDDPLFGFARFQILGYLAKEIWLRSWIERSANHVINREIAV